MQYVCKMETTHTGGRPLKVHTYTELYKIYYNTLYTLRLYTTYDNIILLDIEFIFCTII